ncbi:hypothetical protein [Vibrio harveyi]|uniref:hypothetical protein n=1 Tax=Vibrio harveyi TaxID=669 RepID=UPI0003458EB4|nr:hypothetical protein [Vibrio harveyi]
MIFELHGKDSETLNKRVLTWQLHDSSGDKADRCSVTLDAQDLEVMPASETEYNIVINGENRGKFQISTVTEMLHPEEVTIQLTPAKFSVKDPTGWREPRKRTFPPATVGDVVNAVMLPHGYEVRIAPNLASRKTEHLNQNEETDKQFISRLADKHDAVAKPIDDLFVFGQKGNINALSGKKKKPVIISKVELTKKTGKVDYPSNNRYKGAKASWRVAETGANGEIKIGSEPFYFLKQTFKTEAEATQEAEDKLQSMTRKGQTFSGSIEGKAGFFAESVLTLEGFNNKRVTGAWSVDEVTLSGSRTSYKIQVTASRPRG